MAFDMKAYQNQYQKDNIVNKRVPFHRKNLRDMELLEWAESQEEGFSVYVKRLIEEDKRAKEEENREKEGMGS